MVNITMKTVMNSHATSRQGTVFRRKWSHKNRSHTYRPTDDPTQRVPGSLVEPVEEVVESLLHHVVRGPVVKPVNTRCRYT